MAPNILALQNALIEPAKRMDSSDFTATGLMVAASDAGASGRRSCGSMGCRPRCEVRLSGRQGYFWPPPRLSLRSQVGDSTTNFNVPQKASRFRFFEVVACICSRNFKKWRQRIPFRDASLFKRLKQLVVQPGLHTLFFRYNMLEWYMERRHE